MSDMKFATELQAIDPQDGQLKTWRGPAIYGDNMEAAQAHIYNTAGYLRIVGHYDEGGNYVAIEPVTADANG